MKKEIVTMLLAAALMTSSLTACNDVEVTGNDIDNTTTENTTIEALYTQQDTMLAYIEDYEIFQGKVKNNPYDKWFEIEKVTGTSSKEQLYTNYLALWKNELAFTAENAEIFFETKQQYNAWTTYLEQWLTATETVFEIETEILENSAISPLGALVSHCQLVREKVIETKNYISRLEFHKTEGADYSEIKITWVQDQVNNQKHSVVSSSEIDIIQNRFYANDGQSMFATWLQYELSKINTDADDAIDEATTAYRKYLDLWNTEFTFTVENGEKLFENADKYDQWKNALKKLQESTKTLARCEYSILITKNIEFLIPFCEFSHQQTISTKFFLYYWEYQQKAAENIGTFDVTIEWSPK